MLRIINYLDDISISNIIDSELGIINAERRATDPIWLDQQVQRGNISEKSKEILLDMTKILEETYPDLWDIQVSKTRYKIRLDYDNPSSYGLRTFSVTRIFHILDFDIIIRFPEIEIKNGYHNKHIIKDLYVKIQLRQNKTQTLILSPRSESEIENNPDVIKHDGYFVKFSDLSVTHSLYGLRGTLSKEEYFAGYFHSHLGSKTNYDLRWSNFCLGSGEINQTLMLLRQVDGYDSNLFSMLLLQIDSYVRWESISGVPHIRMSTISQSSNTPLVKLPSLRMTEVNNIIQWIQNKYKHNPIFYPTSSFNFDWKMNGKNPVLILNDKIDKFLRIHADYNPNVRFHFYQDTEGNYYSISGATQRTLDRDRLTRNTFVFQGQVKSLVVEEDNNPEVIINRDYIFHPKIKLILKQKLEAYAINAKIRSDLSQRADQAYNSRRAIKEDTISL